MLTSSFCQLYGRLVDRPVGWPSVCFDVEQLAASLGRPRLPLKSGEHNALVDASLAISLCYRVAPERLVKDSVDSEECVRYTLLVEERGDSQMRTDEHRPSAIEPRDYRFVGYECEKYADAQTILGNQRIIREDMEATGGRYSGHEHGGNCGVCGAWAIYTALFHHKPSNTYVRTGLDCAEKMFSHDSSAFRVGLDREVKLQGLKAHARKYLEDRSLGRVMEIYEARKNTPASAALDILVDVVRKLVKYGSLSEKQEALLARLAHQIDNADEIAAKRKAEDEAAKPVPAIADRTVVVGEVVSTKVTDWGPKMLVRHADGWKVWGSVPKGIDPKRGDFVQFTASIVRSDRDEKFGFFKRPAKASIMEAQQ